MIYVAFLNTCPMSTTSNAAVCLYHRVTSKNVMSRHTYISSTAEEPCPRHGSFPRALHGHSSHSPNSSRLPSFIRADFQRTSACNAHAGSRLNRRMNPHSYSTPVCSLCAHTGRGWVRVEAGSLHLTLAFFVNTPCAQV